MLLDGPRTRNQSGKTQAKLSECEDEASAEGLLTAKEEDDARIANVKKKMRISL